MTGPCTIVTACFFCAALLLGCGGAREKVAAPESREMDAGADTDLQEIEEHASAAVFILPRCPHAAEAMRSLIALKREMGPALGLSVGYVGRIDNQGEIDTSAGEVEIDAARVQICVGITADDAEWLDFLECLYEADRWRSMPDGWQDCAAKAGLDQDEVVDCLESGEGDAVLARTYAVAMASRIQSSPTLFIDDYLYIGSRSLDALRTYFCHQAGIKETMPPACANVDPPPVVAATLLYDSRCKDTACDVSSDMVVLGRLIPGLELTPVDFTTEQGRHLFDLILKTGTKARNLPLIVLEQGLGDNESIRERLGDYLITFGKGFLLDMHGGWDPLAEICDNEIDDTGNDKVDCDDPSCSEKIDCREEQKGRLDLFIMSGCPFAAQLLPVVDRFLEHFANDRTQVDLHLQFIGEVEDGKLKSMHGEEEVTENLRMICAENLYGKDYRFMDYVTCRAEMFDSPNWEQCVPKWMSRKKLVACAEGKKGRELLEESFSLAGKLGIEGSPSWLLNNRFFMRGRDLSSIISSYCESNQSAACDKEIVEDPDGGVIDTDDNTERKCQ